MASLENKSREDMARQNSKESQKGRKKSTVPNWLKKHTLWGRKNNSVASTSSGFLGTSTPPFAVSTGPTESEKRKESLWKKGLAYVRSPKASLPKTASASINPSLTLQNSFMSVFDFHQQQQAFFEMALQSSPEIFLGFAQDPRTCFYAANLQQAYLQRCRERAACLEHLRAQQFLMANLQQAAIINEQARAAAASLNQGYFPNDSRPLMSFPNCEPMDCENKDSIEEMEAATMPNGCLQKPRTSNQSLNQEPMNAMHCDADMTECGHAGDALSPTTDENSKSLLSSCGKSKPDGQQELLSAGHINTADAMITDHNTSLERFHTLPYPNKEPSLMTLAEGVSGEQNNRNSCHDMRKISPLLQNKVGTQHKRLKRNAISAEPSSCNEAVVASALFNKSIYLAVPKSPK